MGFRTPNRLLALPLPVTLLAVIVLQTCSGSQISLEVTSNIVETMKTITEGEIKIVQLNYTLTGEVMENDDNLQLVLCVSVEDKEVASVHSGESRLVSLAEQPSGQFNFSVKGLFLGRTYMHVRFVFSRQNQQSPCQLQTAQSTSYDIDNHFNFTNVLLADDQTATSFEGHREIVVIRQHRAIDTAFNVGVIVLVLIVNLGVGCKTDLAVIKETLRRPVAPLTGFCSQFIIMPLISFAAVKLFDFEPALALGFFALGCSPGGSASNAYTMLLDGDVSLSITMTFISTLAALGMVPLWLLTLGRTLYSDSSIIIPYQNIFYSLLGLLVPVGLGIIIKRKRPGWAHTLIKVSKGMMVVFLIYVFTLGIYTNLYIFHLITWPVLGASAILPYLGFFLGGLVAFLCRMSSVHVLTVAVETGIQNTGIAIVLLLLSLSHPESDISIVAPIISAIFTPLPLWLAIAVVQVRKRWCRKHGDAESSGHDDREAREALKSEEEGKNGKEEEENGMGLKHVENSASLKFEDSHGSSPAI